MMDGKVRDSALKRADQLTNSFDRRRFIACRDLEEFDDSHPNKLGWLAAHFCGLLLKSLAEFSRQANCQLVFHVHRSALYCIAVQAAILRLSRGFCTTNGREALCSV